MNSKNSRHSRVSYNLLKNKAIQWISRVKKGLYPLVKKVLNDIVYDIFKRLIIMAVFEAFKQILLLTN